MDEVERLRRFALVAAALLFAYSAAGVEVSRNEVLAPLGVPISITRPEFIFIAVVFLSVYGTLRFAYYGIMLERSPYRWRRELLAQLHAEGGYGEYNGSVYLGPQFFSTTPLVQNRSDVERKVQQILSAFPGIGSHRPSARIKAHQSSDETGEVTTFWEAEVHIPWISRWAAFVQDIDYMAPLWANGVALAIAAGVSW